MFAARITPHIDLERELRHVDMPARYVGGEFGQILKPDASIFRVGLSYPDLYEIGMSNTALKVLYGMINSMDGIAAERVFVPAPDFEQALRARSTPLYTLETGTPLHALDILAVSFGFELLATNVLNLLDLGGVPLKASERSDSDPLVVLGGPGATNPIPLAQFVDGVFVGEAEAALPGILQELSARRRRGAGRAELIGVLDEHPRVWTRASDGVARRAIWTGFAADNDHSPYGAGFPLPAIPIVQDHGPVEIMRGCPHACRFCHAAVYYRPFRSKSHEQVVRDVRWLVHQRGYRDITLSSLSTGDYAGLPLLLRRLQEEFQDLGVSFQLPSLRVDSVTLPMIESLNGGKRSGLTFAVEAGSGEMQCSLNKPVPLERVTEIAREAASRGWKHAKLYFMIGLPGLANDRQIADIVDYVTTLRRSTRMDFVVNVGSFVPKPHTPYQWDKQLSVEEAQAAFRTLEQELPRGAKLRSHDPWLSQLEGILARGAEDAGHAVEAAFLRGARLDAWGEHLRRDIWNAVLDEHPGVRDALGERNPEDGLPWDGVDLGTRHGRLRIERARASGGTLSDRCRPDCTDHCGVCSREVHVRDLAAEDATTRESSPQALGQHAEFRSATKADPASGEGASLARRVLVLRYRRSGPARYSAHLGILRVMERFLIRSGVPVQLTEGYAPKPRMSFGQPLPLGCSSEDEVVCVDVQKNIRFENVSRISWSQLPDGIELIDACLVEQVVGSRRVQAPMQRYGGMVVDVQPEVRPEVHSRFKRACEEYGIVWSEVPTDVSGSEGVLRLELRPDQPGIGKLVRLAEVQRDVRLWQRQLLDRDGGALFDWYRSQAAPGTGASAEKVSHPD